MPSVKRDHEPAYNAAGICSTAVESLLRCRPYREISALLNIDERTASVGVRRLWSAPRFCRKDAARPRGSRSERRPRPGPTTGFRAASGQFFAFLDATHEWDETFSRRLDGISLSGMMWTWVIGNACNRGVLRDEPSPRARAWRRHADHVARDSGLRNLSLFNHDVFRRRRLDPSARFDPPRSFLTN